MESPLGSGRLKQAAVSVALSFAMALTSAGALAQGGAPLYRVQREQISIPMRDGTRLAADLLLPVGGTPGEKFPAVFKYDPYRKNDNRTIAPECDINEYFVARGYVGACVDVRGTGRSEGHAPDREYSKQELDDGEDVIAWLAKQPWSSGTVGVFGKSWSGFNAIQLAMREPPALKAIVTVDSTEELYSEDVHYTHGITNFGDQYNFSIDARNAVSSSPDFPVDAKSLESRFDNPPWTLLWLRHQRDDPFWHEPVKPLSAIHIPVLVIGGLVDGYRDTVPRYLAELSAPVRAIVGPWDHFYPHDALPGPTIEWRDLAVRWWDRWLKGRDTGVMSEPKLAVYMRHWFPPDPDLAQVPGEWRAEDSWPPRNQTIQTFYLLSSHALSPEPAATGGVHTLRYVPSVGREAGLEDFGLQPDQRPLDAASLVYDSAPLVEDRAILGLPEIRLRASATAPLADWFARLSDVAPDGRTTLITSGALNGSQRDSMASPRDLVPGKRYALRVPLHFTSWVFPAGHRIRVSISNAQWPTYWPTPYSMTTSLYLGGDEASRLLLPSVPIMGTTPSPHFSPIADADRPAAPQAHPSFTGGTLVSGNAGKSTVFEFDGPWSKPEKWPWGTYTRKRSWKYEVNDAQPELASTSGSNDFRVQLPERDLLWHVEWNLRSDRTNFYYLLKRELLENGKVVREKTWKDTVPRDHQ
jgi:putative CocE/NonD family hydrolase